jgi:hypothetical protein
MNVRTVNAERFMSRNAVAKSRRETLRARGKVLAAMRLTRDRTDFHALDTIEKALTVAVDALNQALALERGRRR